MKLSLIASLLLAAGLTVQAQQPMPRMTTVDPANGKVGDVITVAGENLEKDQVSKVFLTDGKNDVTVEITQQNATSIKFKIPSNTSPGRFALMLLTAGKEPKLIEQPVKMTVEQ
ncbi:MAG TPA: IPT/TIG domain-containing protein [Bryobacteraceae bacterium]|jgi:hypothetical protein|nr:IPT/TIG domain-containing protein [Bryobacteraceae bacterium]